MMARVRNASPGPRILNVLRAARGKNAEPTPEQVLIEPGEEQDLEEQGLELADPEDPVLLAMCESGEIVLDGSEPSEEDEEAAAQKRYLNDPKYLLDQQLAAEALNTGGISELTGGITSGPITRQTVGPLSVMYKGYSRSGSDTSSAGAGGGTGTAFDATVYGQQYLTLRRISFPAVLVL